MSDQVDCESLTERTSGRMQESAVHYNPFSIEYDGHADVSSYFIVSEEENVLKSSFRGRRLVGKKIPLTNGVQGHIVCNGKSSNNGAGIESLDTFNEVIIWEHDVPPADRMITDALEWIECAAAVSSFCYLLLLYLHMDTDS